MNISVPADDNRNIEVLASGLPGVIGAQVAVDVTMYAPLRRDGSARPRATYQNGAALEDARRDKERRYPELLDGQRCRLVVIAVETGGRQSEEAMAFFQNLADARARSVPVYLRQSAAFAFYRRWTRMFAVAAASAYAASLLDEKEVLALEAGVDGVLPWLPDLLAEARHDIPLAPSALPLLGRAA